MSQVNLNPNTFQGFDMISSIMDLRSKHLARIEEIEQEFNEKLDAETQKLFQLFQKADDMKKANFSNRDQLITFNDMIDEKMNKIFHVVPELENSSQSSATEEPEPKEP